MPNLFRDARAPAATLAVFAVAALMMLVFLNLRANIYDEAILLTGGLNVAQGAVPHRDFYANYGPAQFYVLAGLFKLFGPSFLAARVYDVLVRAAVVAIAYRLLAGRTRPPVALAAAAVCALWMGGASYHLYPAIPALLFSLAGTLWLLPDNGEPAGARRLAMAGACTGLVALFRYDVGFFVFAAHAIFILAVALAGAGPLVERSAGFIRRSSVYALGTGLVFVPPAAVLLLSGAGPGFLHDIIAYPSQYYVAMRGLPFPGWAVIRAAPVEAANYLPFAAAAVAAAGYVRFGGKPDERSGAPAADKAFVILLGTLCLALSLKGLVRIHSIHMMLAIIPSTLLLAFLIDRSRLLPRAAMVAVMFVSLVAVAAPAYQALQFAWTIARNPSLSLAGRLLGVRVKPGADASRMALASAPASLPVETACAADYVAAVTRPGERIFSGTGRHDKIFANNIMLYFASGRLPGTHWYQFDPGLQNRRDVQGRIVADLKRNGVRWAVADGNWDTVIEPNGSARSSGVRVLDDYLRRNYREVVRFGRISVWLVNSSKTPRSFPFMGGDACTELFVATVQPEPLAGGR